MACGRGALSCGLLVGLLDRTWCRDENHFVRSEMRWSDCLNGRRNARRMQASSWDKDTSSRQANERVSNVIDATCVAVVLDGDDIKTDLRCVDIVDAQEMMRSLNDAFLLSVIDGFNACIAKPPLAHLDFHKYPHLPSSADEVDFIPIPTPITQKDLGVVFFEVNDRQRLAPTASFGCIHGPMMGVRRDSRDGCFLNVFRKLICDQFKTN